MSVFTEPEYRFTTALQNGKRLVTCQASNSLLVTDADGSISAVVKAEFQMPQGVVESKATGDIFVVDRYAGCVKVFRPFDSEEDISHHHPSMLRRPFGCVKVPRPFDSDQDILTSHYRTIGAGTLNQPVGIAIDHERDELYVADNENHRIAAFKTDGTFLLTLGRGYGQELGQLFCPCGVAFYKNIVVVAEWGNGRLQVFKDGKSIVAIGGMPHAHDVVVNDKGEGFLALYSHKAVQRFRITLNDDGYPCIEFDWGGDRISLEHNPTSLFFDENGKLGVVTKTKLLRDVY